MLFLSVATCIYLINLENFVFLSRCRTQRNRVSVSEDVGSRAAEHGPQLISYESWLGSKIDSCNVESHLVTSNHNKVGII